MPSGALMSFIEYGANDIYMTQSPKSSSTEDIYDNIYIKYYNEVKLEDLENKECSITGEIMNCPVKLDKCEHIFEKYAIDEWLNVSSNCPLCRTEIKQKYISNYNDYDLTQQSDATSTTESDNNIDNSLLNIDIDTDTDTDSEY